MLVTDKKYYMDNLYVSKLDLMIKRMKGTDDNVLIFDGDEGQGKTEFATGTCYYVAQEMGREYNINNIFFKIDEAVEFAATTKEKIIHIDEGALGLLTTQWWGKAQQKFIQLVMMARKKKHFIVICIPKFYKLSQYVAQDRAIGLVHVYSKGNMIKGRFSYFTKKNKDKLFEDWNKRKLRSYKKNTNFHGKFIMAMHRVFTKEQMIDYEKKKDDAIMSISVNKDADKKHKFQDQRDRILKHMVEKAGFTQKEISNKLKEDGIELSRERIGEIIRSQKNQQPLIVNG